MADDEDTRSETRAEIDSHTFNLMCCGALTRLLDDSFDETLAVFLEESGGSEEVDGCSAQAGWNNNVVRNLKGKMSHSLKKSISALSGHSQKKKPGINEPFSWFGCPVPEDGPIPIIQLLEHLDDNAELEGLFRISGSKRRQGELKSVIQECDEELDMIDIEDRFTPHDIASVIKQYFSEMPSPLLSQQFLEIYFAIGKLRTSQRIEALQLICLMLPPAHRELLMLLLSTLSMVADHSAVNKMDAYNLAIVFVPNLINIPPENSEEMAKMTGVVTDMIKHKTAIFEVHKEVEWQMRLFVQQLEAGEDNVPLAITKTSCQQKSLEEYEEETREHTSRELLQLYEQVQKMPEGKQKQYFMKKFVNGAADMRPFINSTPKKAVSTVAKRAGLNTPQSALRCSQREVLECSSVTRRMGKWGTPRKRRNVTDISPNSKQSRDSDTDSLGSFHSGRSMGSPELTNKENTSIFRQTRV